MTPHVATTDASRRSGKTPEPLEKELSKKFEIDPKRGDRVLLEVFKRLCRLVNSPFSYYALELARARDFERLSLLKVDPFFYEWNGRKEEFAGDYQIACFFKKYQDFPIVVDREKAAYDKWLDSERRCKLVNDYFRKRWNGETPPLSFPVEEILHLARRKITSILGTVKPADLAFIRDSCRHGPGADTALRRSTATAYAKYQTTGQIVPACVALYDDVFGNEGDHRQDFAHNARLTLCSKLSFVPKTSRIDRAICVEPRWNVYIQLGIGELVQNRLLTKTGTNIRDQSRNQQAARDSDRDGLATVDLSAASDSISTNLVVDLLSCCDPLWLDLLLKSRCAYTQYKRMTFRLEKISSMGNGYTFPLETLIFYAFAWAATRHFGGDAAKVRVYGDDIILPRVAYSGLVEALNAFGFAVNTDKSFASGSFFESCGQDFMDGREVRPLFVENRLDSITSMMVLHNQILHWSRLQDFPGFYDSKVRGILNYIVSELPKTLRFFGPVGLGGCLHAPFDLCKPTRPKPRDPRFTQEGYFYMCIINTPTYESKYGYYGHLWSKLSADVDCRNRVLVPLQGYQRVARVFYRPVVEITWV